MEFAKEPADLVARRPPAWIAHPDVHRLAAYDRHRERNEQGVPIGVRLREELVKRLSDPGRQSGSRPRRAGVTAVGTCDVPEEAPPNAGDDQVGLGWRLPL